MIDKGLINNELVSHHSLPNPLLWILFHSFSLPCFIIADWFLTPIESKNFELLCMPLLLGVGQMLFLWKQLRWPWLWPLLTLLGIPVSFLGIWWFMLCLGGGFGLFQSMHLWFSGFRRVYLWLLASFTGWLGGVLVWLAISNSLELKVSYLYEMTGLHLMVGLVYGSFIYIALRLMKRKSAQRLALPLG